MRILSVVLTAVMFSAVACGGSNSGSGSNAEVVTDVVAECVGGGMVQTGAPCFRDEQMQFLLREAYWKVTIQKPDGTTYTREVPASRKPIPQIGDPWPLP